MWTRGSGIDCAECLSSQGDWGALQKPVHSPRLCSQNSEIALYRVVLSHLSEEEAEVLENKVSRPPGGSRLELGLHPMCLCET